MASSVSDYNRLHGPTHQLHTEVRHVKGVATCLRCSPVSKHSQRKYCLWLYLISIKSSHSVANQDRKSQPQSSTWAVRSRSVSSNRHEPASQTFISENEALKPPVVSTITSWQLLSFRTNLQLHLSSECFCCCQNVVYIQTFIKTGRDQFTKTKCRFVWTKKHPCGEVLLLFDISGLLKKCNTWRMSQDLWTLRDFSDHRRINQLKQLQKLKSKSKIQPLTEPGTESQIWNVVRRTDWWRGKQKIKTSQTEEEDEAATCTLTTDTQSSTQVQYLSKST